ncbi:MAG TPA: 2-oxoacid:acceptor oxidoreductase family protein [Myxococcota bacterium]|jgi:Pyruvate/2-oxoacid:ferredoxin oxidoreductase gamma subunit
MEREILLTGIGGQGVQLAAQILARAAIREGRHVMSLGTYGGSMRGGNTDSTLILGAEPISAPPIVARSWAGIGAHPRYWGGVRAKLRSGGVAVWNAELFGAGEDAGAAHALPVQATALATRVGSAQGASLVLIGALAGATGLVGLDALIAAMQEALPPYRREHAAKNAEALRAGFDAAPRGVARAWSEA